MKDARIVLSLIALALTGCATTGDVLPVVPTGKGTYEIRVPTDKMARTPLKMTSCCAPDRTLEVPDVVSETDRAGRRASKFCAKMNQTLVITGGEFDLGPGLTLIFKCIPPQKKGSG